MHLVDRHAVVEVAHASRPGSASALTSAPRPAQAESISACSCVDVERHALAAVEHVQRRRLRRFAWRSACARSCARRFAVQHVGARDLVLAAAHQAELDLVLHVLDVEGAAARARAQQRADDGSVSWSTVSRTLAEAAPCVPCTARNAFIMRDGDLVRLEADHGAVAADDLVAA